jgi:ubiquinone biosynthesis protein COQ9
MAGMNDEEFDVALVGSALRLAAERGWARVNVPAAAQAEGLSLAEARGRFPNRLAILRRFGQILDQTALVAVPSEGTVRDRLFDLLMRRFDALQVHRAGVQALLKSLPCDPPSALFLACNTRQSMRWMLQAAGVSASGLRGELRTRGLLAVWLWGVRAWQHDDSPDLSTTMAAVDTALNRAEGAETWLARRSSETARTDQGPSMTPADDGEAGPGPMGSSAATDGPPTATDEPHAG